MSASLYSYNISRAFTSTQPRVSRYPVLSVTSFSRWWWLTRGDTSSPPFRCPLTIHSFLPFRLSIPPFTTSHFLHTPHSLQSPTILCSSIPPFIPILTSILLLYSLSRSSRSPTLHLRPLEFALRQPWAVTRELVHTSSLAFHALLLYALLHSYRASSSALRSFSASGIRMAGTKHMSWSDACGLADSRHPQLSYWAMSVPVPTSLCAFEPHRCALLSCLLLGSMSFGVPFVLRGTGNSRYRALRGL
ncbi:hypothetical protein C8R47DRAFT_396366 [Mycena vitilis]|nr:hypothetical protein C8R47DRAFT_396366 [Mycena vitilis]